MNSSDTTSLQRFQVTGAVSIVPRGKRGIWCADFNHEGKHRRKSLKTRNKRVAEERARELDRELRENELPASLKAMRIDAAIDAFIEAKKTDGHAHKTLVKYEAELRNLEKHVAERGVVTIPRLTLILYDGYKASRKNNDGLEPYTLYNNAIIAKTWLKWCKKRKLIATNPLEDLEANKPPRRRYPAPTLDQVNAILAKGAEYMLAVLATAAFSGLRIGEIAALRPDDVDLSKHLLHVRRHSGWGPKTSAGERSVPIHARLLAILKAYNGAHALGRERRTFFTAPPSAQFPDGDHSINPRTVNVIFQQFAGACGCTIGRAKGGLTEHALRRFFKTSCLDAGVPLPLVDIWLGHAGTEMNQIYYRPQVAATGIARVPFGDPSDTEAQRAKGASHASP